MPDRRRPSLRDLPTESVDFSATRQPRVLETEEQRPSLTRQAFSRASANLQAIPSAVGSAVAGAAGREDTARRLAGRAVDIQQRGAERSPDVRTFTDLRDPDTGQIDWRGVPEVVGTTLVENAPSLALQIGAGIAGRGAAGSAVRRALRSPRAAPRSPRAAQEIVRRAETAGALGGASTAGMGLMAADIVPRIQPDVEDSGLSQTEASRLALAGTVAGGGLQAVPMGNLFRTLGLTQQAGQQVQRSLTQRVVRGIGSQIAAEVPVDAAQAMISRGVHRAINDEIGLLDDEGRLELINAVLASAVTAVPSGGLAAVGGAARNRLREDREERESERAMAQFREASAERLNARLAEADPDNAPLYEELASLGFSSPQAQQRLVEARVAFARNRLGGMRENRPLRQRVTEALTAELRRQAEASEDGLQARRLNEFVEALNDQEANTRRIFETVADMALEGVQLPEQLERSLATALTRMSQEGGLNLSDIIVARREAFRENLTPEVADLVDPTTEMSRATREAELAAEMATVSSRDDLNQAVPEQATRTVDEDTAASTLADERTATDDAQVSQTGDITFDDSGRMMAVYQSVTREYYGKYLGDSMRPFLNPAFAVKVEGDELTSIEKHVARLQQHDTGSSYETISYRTMLEQQNAQSTPAELAARKLEEVERMMQADNVATRRIIRKLGGKRKIRANPDLMLDAFQVISRSELPQQLGGGDPARFFPNELRLLGTGDQAVIDLRARITDLEKQQKAAQTPQAKREIGEQLKTAREQLKVERKAARDRDKVSLFQEASRDLREKGVIPRGFIPVQIQRGPDRDGNPRPPLLRMVSAKRAIDRIRSRVNYDSSLTPYNRAKQAAQDTIGALMNIPGASIDFDALSPNTVLYTFGKGKGRTEITLGDLSLDRYLPREMQANNRRLTLQRKISVLTAQGMDQEGLRDLQAELDALNEFRAMHLLDDMYNMREAEDVRREIIDGEYVADVSFDVQTMLEGGTEVLITDSAAIGPRGMFQEAPQPSGPEWLTQRNIPSEQHYTRTGALLRTADRLQSLATRLRQRMTKDNKVWMGEREAALIEANLQLPVSRFMRQTVEKARDQMRERIQKATAKAQAMLEEPKRRLASLPPDSPQRHNLQERIDSIRNEATEYINRHREAGKRYNKILADIDARRRPTDRGYQEMAYERLRKMTNKQYESLISRLEAEAARRHAQVERQNLEDRIQYFEREVQVAGLTQEQYETLAYQLFGEAATGARIDAESRAELIETLRAQEAARVAPVTRVAPVVDEATPAETTPAERVSVERLEIVADGWLERVGLDSTRYSVVNDDGLAAMLREMGENPSDLLNNNEFSGFILPGYDGTFVIYISSKLSEADAITTLAHEVGHAIFREKFVTLPREQQQAVVEEFQKWYGKIDSGKTTVLDVLSSRLFIPSLVNRSIERANDKFYDMPLEEQAYVLSFEEWFADNAGRWLTARKAPRSIAEKFFAGIADSIKALYDQVREALGRQHNIAVAKNVNTFMNSIWAKDATRQEIVAQRRDVEARDAAYEGTPVAQVKREQAEQKPQRVPRPDIIRPETPEERAAFEAGVQARAEEAAAMTKDQMEAAYHLRDDPYSEEARRSFVRFYDQYMTVDERRVLARFMMSPQARRIMREKLGPRIGAQIDQGHVSAAIGHGFQLWMAGELKVPQRPKTLFNNMRKDMETFAGVVMEETNAQALLEALHQGALAARIQNGIVDSPVKRFLRRNRFEEVVANTMETGEKILSAMRPIYASLISRMYDTQNPVLESLADQFWTRSTSEGRSEDMFTSRYKMMSRFHNMFHRATENLTKDQAAKLARLLQTEAEVDASTPVGKAASDIRTTLRRMYNYARSRGVEMGDLGENYFPMVMNVDNLLNHSEEFINLLVSDNFADRLLIENEDGTVNDTPERRRNAAHRILRSLTQNDGYADTEDHTKPQTGGHVPFMGSSNKRSLNWLMQLATPEQMNQIQNRFMEKDIGKILTAYVEQTVKRAEFVGRFGRKGEGLDAIYQDAVRAGASAQDLQLARNYVSAMMGSYGQEFHPYTKAVLNALGKPFDKQWGDQDPKQFRKLQGAFIVYQNLRTLGLATLTSLADVGGIITRSNSPGVALHAFKQGMREISLRVRSAVAGDKDAYRSELRQMAETLGVIDLNLVNEVLGENWGGQYLTGTARRVNERFFNAIQLQRWTRFSRMMGLSAGQQYLMKLKRGEGSFGKNQERWLSQLGLRSIDDIVLDDNGNIQLLSDEERVRLLDSGNSGEVARDDRLRAALTRFVDQAVMRPNPSQRPLWGSHPDMALLFHLKQFVYTIHEQVVVRTFSEAARGNWMPTMMIFSYVPVMVAADILREMIQHGPDGDPRKRHWGLDDYLRDGVHRSGMLGLGTFVLDARKDRREFGGVGYESLQGPALSQTRELTSILLGDPNLREQRWKRFRTNSLPLNNVYKNWNFMPDTDDDDWQRAAVGAWRN